MCLAYSAVSLLPKGAKIETTNWFVIVKGLNYTTVDVALKEFKWDAYTWIWNDGSVGVWCSDSKELFLHPAKKGRG